MTLLKRKDYDPNRKTDALFLLVDHFYKIGNIRRAISLIDRMLRISGDGGLWHIKGMFHAANGEWEAAASAFQESWERFPESPQVQYWYGKTLIQIGKYDIGCRLLGRSRRNLIDMNIADASRKLFDEKCSTGPNRKR
jgi:tetratricopeptide (TPR) repeat protein